MSFLPSRGHFGRELSQSQAQNSNFFATGYHANAYQGETDDFVLRNRDCTEENNCAVFITNIPVTMYNAEVFDQIYEGGVFSYHRRPPIGNYRTCAAMLAFKRPEAAKALIDRAKTPEGFCVKGIRLPVISSRDRIAPVSPEGMVQTRLLHVTGPEQLISADEIEAFLHTKIVFKLVRRSVCPMDGQRRTVELEFCSIRGQSRAAMKALICHFAEKPYGSSIDVKYGPDPCGN